MGAKNGKQNSSESLDNNVRARRFTVESMDQAMVTMKYAVRGAVVERAAELQKKLDAGEKLPFDHMVLCNIGNPQAVKQKPITFYRQVAAACMYPPLAESGDFPEDVKARALEYIKCTGGNGMGAYTDSIGLALIRKQVAEFIERRDGFPADPDAVHLTTGASEAVKRCIAALLAGPQDGIMIPKPQYPLYSASITLYGGQTVYYDLDEQTDWKISKANLLAKFTAAKANGIAVRAIAVINPGNPSGAVLDLEDIKLLIDFSVEQKVVILADEVYQENIYAEGKEFHSFKKVLRQMEQTDQQKYAAAQIISFHSTSKGLLGECGQRGGYMETIGLSENTLAQFKKVAASSLCSNTLGQIFVGLMVTPPKEGEPSYKLFTEERDALFSGLKRRAVMVSEGLNAIPGISSRAVQGAMYAFPKVTIPVAAHTVAKEKNLAPDEFWCLQLVEETGVVCVPGSGFGQEEGTFHFRITILPPEDMVQGMLGKLKAFQANFMAKYSEEEEQSCCTSRA